MSAKKVVGAIFQTVFRLVVAVAVLYLVYRGAINAYNFGYRIFADIPCALSPGRDIQMTITEAEAQDTKTLAQDFEQAGLVEDWKVFWTQIQFSEYKDTIQTGVFELNNSMTSEEMLEIIGADPDASQEE
jgi:UPF0755 protein